jgi:hypothetical protein
LPLSGHCEVVYIEYHDLRVKVAVEPRACSGAKLSVDQVSRLSGHLHRLITQAELPVQVVDTPQSAQWVLEQESAEKDHIYLRPSRETRLRGLVREAEDQPELPTFGPLPVAKIAELLTRHLGNIARATNLLSLAERLTTDQSGGSLVPDVDIELVRYWGDGDPAGQVVESDDGEMKLRQGDLVALQVKNHGSVPVDITVLHINGSNYSMRLVFPMTGNAANNRVLPGKTLVTNRAKPTASTRSR